MSNTSTTRKLPGSLVVPVPLPAAPPTIRHHHRGRSRRSHGKPRKCPSSPPSLSQLPFHLQDPNHPITARKRKPSSLSTHSYDLRSPAQFRGHSPHLAPPHGGKSPFSPAGCSRGSSPSLSPSPWYLTPHSPHTHSFDHWPEPGHAHHLISSRSVDLLNAPPTHSARSSRKSYSFASYHRKSNSLVSEWYDDIDSQDSMSTLSTISNRAVVHPQSCRSLPVNAFDYITPVCVRPRGGGAPQPARYRPKTAGYWSSKCKCCQWTRPFLPLPSGGDNDEVSLVQISANISVDMWNAHLMMFRSEIVCG